MYTQKNKTKLNKGSLGKKGYMWKPMYLLVTNQGKYQNNCNSH